MSKDRPAKMTPKRRALRIDRRASGRFVVALWQDSGKGGVLRVIRQGRMISLRLGPDDFEGRPLSAVRWLAKKYDVDAVYLVRSQDDADTASTCRKFTRAIEAAKSKPKEGTVSDPDFRPPS